MIYQPSFRYRLIECHSVVFFEPLSYGSYEQYCDACYTTCKSKRVLTMNISCIAIDTVGGRLQAIVRRCPIIACSRSVCPSFSLKQPNLG